jgi:hypothetical protein
MLSYYNYTKSKEFNNNIRENNFLILYPSFKINTTKHNKLQMQIFDLTYDSVINSFIYFAATGLRQNAYLRLDYFDFISNNNLIMYYKNESFKWNYFLSEVNYSKKELFKGEYKTNKVFNDYSSNYSTLISKERKNSSYN